VIIAVNTTSVAYTILFKHITVYISYNLQVIQTIAKIDTDSQKYLI